MILKIVFLLVFAYLALFFINAVMGGLIWNQVVSAFNGFIAQTALSFFKI